MSSGWNAHHGIFVTVLLQADAEYGQNSIHHSRGLLAAADAFDVGMVPGQQGGDNGFLLPGPGNWIAPSESKWRK